jgi:hypothetical protein
VSDSLDRLARRLEDDPGFLACALAEYARSEGLDDAGLARLLGCAAADLTGVRLCRAPRPGPADFRADVRHVAERFALDAARLMEVVRAADALRLLREGAAAAPGFLMAARDREDEPPPSEEDEEP